MQQHVTNKPRVGRGTLNSSKTPESRQRVGSGLFCNSVTTYAIWPFVLACLGGCGLLHSDRPSEKISESLPAPARFVADFATSVPSHRRNWRPELSVLPYAEIDDTQVTVRNVRQCRWRSESDYDVKHDDWQFRWNDVQATDFIVIPFKDTPSLAHTMLSFALRDGRHLALSVEARLEAGEAYSPVAGIARQYDMIYVLGDEIDLLGLRGEVRRDDVYIYRSIATPDQSVELLKSVLLRTNQLLEHPEFYDSVRNSCATNVANHIEQLAPRNLMSDWRLLLPGHSDKLAYDLRLVDTSLPFESVRKQAYASVKIRQYLGEEQFSRLIRR